MEIERFSTAQKHIFLRSVQQKEKRKETQYLAKVAEFETGRTPPGIVGGVGGGGGFERRCMVERGGVSREDKGVVGGFIGMDERAKVMYATPKRRLGGKQPPLRDKCSSHWSLTCLFQGQMYVKVIVACGRMACTFVY